MDARRRPPDDVFDFDGDYGAQYEKLARQVIPGYEHLFLATVALLDGKVRDDAQVLVVGCGTGIEMVTFGQAKPGWRLTGVDPSLQMIQLAHEKLKSKGLAGRFRLHHGYTDDLPPQPVYDAATLVNVMHFLPDDGAKSALLQSIAIRLRPGGHFVVVDLHGDPETPEFATLMAAWKEYMLIRGMATEEREVFLHRLDQGIHYVPESRVLTLLEQAGFQGITKFYGAFLYGGWILRRVG